MGATVEDRGFDRRVTAGGVHELLREAYRALPMIGALSGVAGGHHRNGVLLAPLTAAAIGAMLRGEPVPDAAAALTPERFAASGARA